MPERKFARGCSGRPARPEAPELPMRSGEAGQVRLRALFEAIVTRLGKPLVD